MSGSRFNPSTLVVPPGATVVWRNADGFNHTVTSATAAPETFESKEVGEGGTFEYTFNNLATVRYFCRHHSTGGPTPTGMAGTITVKQ